MDQKDLRILLIHQKLAVIYPYVSLLYESNKHEKMDTETSSGKRLVKISIFMQVPSPYIYLKICCWSFMHACS